MKRWVSIAVAAIVALAMAGFFLRGPGREKESDGVTPRVAPPTLYCEFYNFTHNSTVVSFNFAVGRDAKRALTFSELFVVEPDGTKADHTREPLLWAYGSDDGTPTITSPDAATRIVLYGLRPKANGVFWTEAGVRSNDYRNLEGKCRQAHLDKVVEQ